MVITFAGSTMLGVVRRHWSFITTPLLYGTVGVGVVIFLFLLEYQSDQQIEALEQTGREQVEALERLTSEQGTILNVLAEANPTRPYFTQSLAKIYKLSSDKTFLTVSVQNNNVPAKDVVSHLLVLEASLDEKSGPLHSNREESANPIGPGGTHSHHWGPVNVPQRARPAFVIFLVQYTNALTDKMHSQALFLKFRGASPDGTFIQQLFNATSDEKTEIERYMEKRGLSKL